MATWTTDRIEKYEREGREDMTMQAISVRIGDVNESDGSALWSQGNTWVRAAVYVVPMQALHSSISTAAMEDYGRSPLLVDIALPSTPVSGGSGNSSLRRREKALSSIVEGVLRAVVNLEIYPNRSILIKSNVLTEGGCTEAAIINCVILALLNSGLPMRCTATATAIAVLGENRMLLDPTTDEWKYAQCGGLFVLGHVDTKRSSEEKSDASTPTAPVLYSSFEGSHSIDMRHRSIEVARAASGIILDCMRSAVAGSVKQ